MSSDQVGISNKRQFRLKLRKSLFLYEQWEKWKLEAEKLNENYPTTKFLPAPWGT